MRLARVGLIISVVAALSAPAFADKDADAYYKEGLALKSQGKVDEAITSLKSAVDKNPKLGLAWASLGSLYKLKRDLPKSIDAYEKATVLITKDKNLWMNLGTAYANADPPRLDDALKALGAANKIDPKDGEILWKLGTVKRKKGDHPGAIADLEKAVALKADESDWWHNLGVAYRFGNRGDDAIKAFTKAIELAPNEPRYHFDLAVAYRRHKDKDGKPDPMVEQAIAEYEKATSLEPGNAEGWFDLGFMYKENKDMDKAVFAFNKYLDVNKGKDSAGAKRIEEEVKALGGTPQGETKTPPKKTPAKTPAKTPPAKK